jgi:hypothetical protein
VKVDEGEALKNAFEEAMQEAEVYMEIVTRAGRDGIAALEAREQENGQLTPNEAE